MRIITTATNLLIDTTEDSYLAMFENQPIATACKGATRYEARQALLGKQPSAVVSVLSTEGTNHE